MTLNEWIAYGAMFGFLIVLVLTMWGISRNEHTP